MGQQLTTTVFGWEFKNTRLLADNYAKAGFYCYIPDLHQGDSLPIEFLKTVEPPLKKRESLGIVDKTKNTAIVTTTLSPWLLRHREGISKPLVDDFVKAVRAVPGTGKVGAVGFCWGGRYAILQAHAGDASVDAVVACHPSLVAVPGDFEPVVKPISLAVGDADSLLDNDSVGKIQDILAKKTDIPHELRVYKDAVHGFALRSDWDSEKDKKSMDESEKQGIDWLKKYLS